MQPTILNFFKRSAQTSLSTSTSNAAAMSTMPTSVTTLSESTTDKVLVESSEISNQDGLSEKRQRIVAEETTVVKMREEKPIIRTWVDEEISKLDDEKWKDILSKEATKARPLMMFLNGLPDSRILPPKNKVFEAFRLCSFDAVRVVILGQDPYHGPGQAHGLAFSVREGVQVPPSLKNIFKEAKNDVGTNSGRSGNLECWAKQGVLLLNALLTVEPGTPMAHKGRGWEKFTDNVIAALSKEKKNLVFLLWGKPAQEKGRIVDRSKHLIITSSHPSPLGASQTAEPFLGSRCFSRCNEYLKAHGEGEVDWSVPG